MNREDNGPRGRVIGKLSVLRVRQSTKRGLYGDGGGLFLQVTPGGARSWVFRYKIGGKHRLMGLGPVHTVTLAEARERATECRKLRLAGRDPLDERNAARNAARLDAAKAITFQACAEAYIAAHKAGWRSPRSLMQWEGSLSAYVYPLIGALPVQAVDVGMVMKVLEPIWSEKTETASRVRGRIESVLDWATARGYRTGENPARWRGHLENLLPKRSRVARVEHFAALPYAEIGAFMKELRRQESTAALALEFAVLTATRSAEARGVRWSEINLAERLWTIPADRMKGGREHRIPLAGRALAILDQMYAIRSSDYVFPGQRGHGKPLSHAAFFDLLRRMGRGDLTTHGFRSTFRDWVAECTAFPADVAEMALAHAVGDRVEAAYRRGDLFQKRCLLADAWATFCDAPAPPVGEIVPIRASAEKRPSAADRVCSPISPVLTPASSAPDSEAASESWGLHYQWHLFRLMTARLITS